MNQTTLRHPIHFADIGLHTGKTVSCTLRPAPVDTGIVFNIENETGSTTLIPTPESVVSTGLATTLGQNGVTVSTVEHLLAAIRGLGIDNIYIDVDGVEIPILDGSATGFVDKILTVGIKQQDAPRRFVTVNTPFTYGEAERFVTIEPHHSFVVECVIDFPHPVIGRQEKTLAITPENFLKVARARTFCMLSDVEKMRKHGLALGGGLQNAIVLDKTVLNDGGLRYHDEFVRHKLLDFIGDMAVLPAPVKGKFTVHCSGHSLNNEFARGLMQSGKLVYRTENSALPKSGELSQSGGRAREQRPALAFMAG